jgi:hypothetical protein
MDPATRQLIEAVHRAPGRCVLALTGGGTSAAALLLSVPGGSRTVLEVVVPYDERALTDFLGRRPEQFCSAATGGDLATRALERARWLAPGEPVGGVGCTASLATDRPKRGDHRFHVAVRRGEDGHRYALTLTKGARDRDGEEAVLTSVLLNALAEALGVAGRVPVPLFRGEVLHEERVPEAGPLAAFLRGDVAAVCVEADGRVRVEAPRPAVLLPGAFNPVHEGHRGLAATAARLAGGPAAFELSVTNVDKPALAPEEVRRRLAQFSWEGPLWLTRASTFAEKAVLFPGVAFVVGADTAARVVSPRYYGESAGRMEQALATMRERGCSFLVAARADGAGRLVTLADLALPEAHRDLFRPVPVEAFRLDLSSTQLRGQRTPAHHP